MWEQTRDGSLYLCERAYEPLTGRSRTISVKISKNTAAGRKEALQRLQEKLNDDAPKTRMHLSELIELYEKDLYKTVRYSTYKRNCCSLKTMLEIVDDIYIDHMTSGYVRSKLVDSGKDNGTLNELIKRFKSMLMWAYRNDYLGREVADKLTKFPDKTKKQKIKDKYLEKEELHAIIEAMELERHKLLTEFLALTGLRFGECAALDNVDVGPEYISVTKSYSENFHLLGDPKTESSIREVYIQPELEGVIKRIRVCMAKQRMKFGYEDHGYFFAGPDGDRIGYAAYNKCLKLAAKKAGIDRNITPHVLRHTMVSLFSAAGVPLEIIRRRCGHESSQITSDIYMHITKTHRIIDAKTIKDVTLLA